MACVFRSLLKSIQELLSSRTGRDFECALFVCYSKVLSNQLSSGLEEDFGCAFFVCCSKVFRYRYPAISEERIADHSYVK